MIGSPFLIGAVDRPFQYRIMAMNGATGYGASSLPPGMAVDPSTGMITGQSTQPGMFSAVLTATNALGANQRTVTLVLNLPLPGVAVSGLPAGLTFDSSSGRIGGTPLQMGDFPLSVQASNRYGWATGLMTIRVSSVAAWGDKGYGQTDVPTGLSNVVAVAGGDYHSLALQADGTVVAWGIESYSEATVPADLSNVVAVAAGAKHSLALRADGTVAAWGSYMYGLRNVPAGLTNVVAVAAGGGHSLCLVAAQPIIVKQPANLTQDVDTTATFTVTATGIGPLTYQWWFDGASLSGATNRSYTIPSIQTNHAGLYSVVVSNSFGVAVSSNAVLTVIAPGDPLDEPGIRALFAALKSRAEAHDLDGFMALYSVDYMDFGNDHATMRQRIQNGLSAVQSFTFNIDRIDGAGTNATIHGSGTIVFNNGQSPLSWVEPDSGDQGLGLGWLRKTATGWQVIGNQERASVRVATEHHISPVGDSYLIHRGGT